MFTSQLDRKMLRFAFVCTVALSIVSSALPGPALNRRVESRGVAALAAIAPARPASRIDGSESARFAGYPRENRRRAKQIAATQLTIKRPVSIPAVHLPLDPRMLVGVSTIGANRETALNGSWGFGNSITTAIRRKDLTPTPQKVFSIAPISQPAPLSAELRRSAGIVVSPTPSGIQDVQTDSTRGNKDSISRSGIDSRTDNTSTPDAIGAPDSGNLAISSSRSISEGPDSSASSSREIVQPNAQSASQPESASHSDRVSTKAETKIPVRAEGRGSPFINLKDGRELSINGQVSESAPPTAMASADFDSDGVADLVTADGSGTLRFYRGNSDSIHPNSPHAKRHKAEGTFVDAPFYAGEKSFDLGTTPDFLEAGDFNGDGKKDILALAKNDNRLQLLFGDGHGNFAAPITILLDGRATALAVGDIGRKDGQTDTAIAVQNGKASQLLVFEHPEGAFKHKPEVFKLPAPAADIAIGNLDDDFYGDVAVACGNIVTIVHGRGQAYPWDLSPQLKIVRPPAVVANRTMSFAAAALVVGRFGNQRGQSLAILGGDGNVYHLEPIRSGRPSNSKLPEAAKQQAKRNLFVPADSDVRNLATVADAPISQAQGEKLGFIYADVSEVKGGALRALQDEKIMAQAAAFKKADKRTLEQMAAAGAQTALEQRELAKTAFLNSISARPSTLATWDLQTLVAGSRFAGSAGSTAARKMVRARVSGGKTDDILLLDSASHQIQIISRARTGQKANETVPRDVTSLDVEGGPTAIMPMQLNVDALYDLVVLRQGAAAPSVVMSAPAQFIAVTSTADSGGNCQQLGDNCTLRDAIQLANFSGGAAYIFFVIEGDGVQTIAPLSPLPTIVQTTTIDGTTQPGYNGSPLIEISGVNLAGGAADGLKLRTTDAAIQGLAINKFPSVSNGDGSVTGGNGITIESTTFSPNNGSNLIRANFLGTDATGTVDKGNDATGLNIFDSDNNQIGGTDPSDRNVMSGNGTRDKNGVGIALTAGNFNNFQGNIIGLNALGTGKVGNSKGLFFAGSNNTFGGDDAGAGNTVSGNGEPRPPSDPDPTGCDGFGLTVDLLIDLDTGELLTLNNTFAGNRLGTNPAGTQGLGNCWAAIGTHPLTQTLIGSMSPGGRNVISDNGMDAVICQDFFSIPTAGGYCSISGNNIGTNVAGTVAIPNDARNARSGVQSIVGGTVWVHNNLSLSNVGAPGGTSPFGLSCTGFCNLISGNIALSGVAVERSGYGAVSVTNNFIGTNQDGNQAIPNDNIGVASNSFGDTYIGFGDPNTPGGNLISGNGGYGISVAGGVGQAFTFDTTYIQANFIGTDSSGNFAIPNSSNNSCCFGGAISVVGPYTTQTFIGTTDASARNIVSGNNDNGIRVRDFGGHTTIVNNLVGLNRSLAALGNTGWGITLQGFGTQVGGSSIEEGNQIGYNGSGSSYGGVGVTDDGNGNFGFGNTIRNNSIHDNIGLGIDLGGDGVTVNDECDHDSDFGANMLQNFPELFEPVFNGDGTVTVSGVLKSLPSRHFTIDFYSSSGADPSGHGEGEIYFGATDVSTDTNGFGSFSFTSAAVVSASAVISGTATDDEGSTSEFSCNAGQSCDGLQPARNLKEYLASPQTGCPIAIIVNVTGDESDQNPIDGVCDIDTATPGLQCTLRAALEVVTRPGYLGPFTINFNIPGGGVQTITPQSPLPAITHRVEINATSQPGWSFRPLIELRGDSAGASDGLVFANGSDGANVLGLAINRFLHSGIVFQSNNNNLALSRIGVFADGITIDPLHRQDVGITITGSGNTIGESQAQGNVITANRSYDVLISGATAKNNSVQGNLIGILANGQFQVEGGAVGVKISQGASGNHIGGKTFLQRNELGGPFICIQIADNATLNTVTRNQISNCTYGVAVTRASNNFVGGAITADLDNNPPNIIASNDIGVFLGDEDLFAQAPQSVKTQRVLPPSDSVESSFSYGLSQTPNDAVQTQNNQVQGNLIGMDGSGTIFPNRVGVLVGTATKNTIGGTQFAFRNYISGNTDDGVALVTAAIANTVQQNLIGLAIDGLSKRPNLFGVHIFGSQNKLIKNWISGNTIHGVILEREMATGQGPTGNVLVDNRIGIAYNSDQKVENGGDGVLVLDGAGNQIGDPTNGNLISGNVGNGISISFQADGNSVTRNLIGTNLAGDGPLGNGGAGIEVLSSNNTIQRNTISGNDVGIVIGSDSSSHLTGNTIQKNFIGTNLAGTAAIKNNLDGITVLNGATNTLIGGVDVNGVNAGNTISGNGRDGIRISQGGPLVTNKIQGNLIGTDKSGTFAIMNEKAGIFLQGTDGNLIGGFGADIPQARNIISGNGSSGVDIAGSGSALNRISGNYIGIASDGTSALGNAKWGIVFHGGAHDNIVGGTEPNAANTIAFNKVAVASLQSAGCCNSIDPNVIYANDIIGIDLGCGADAPDGEEVTDISSCNGVPVPNDPGDGDEGPNNLQNYPEFTSAIIGSNGNLVLQYKVDSTPGDSNYGTDGIYVEFFKADGSLQGKTFLGSTYYTSDDYDDGSPGLASFDAGPAAALGVAAGDTIIATATDADGNTSEFTSVNIGVVGNPTAAKLESFTATARDGSVLLNWKTGFEVDNLGFNIYREVDGVRTRITPQLVAGSALSDGPGTSLLSGHNYYWADTPPAGNTVRYWLEDIDLKGKSTFNGPYSITNSAPGSAADAQKQSLLISQIGMRQSLLANGLGSTPVGRAASLATPSAASVQAQTGLASQPAVKIAVKQEGYYRVTQAELLGAALDPKVDPRLLQLFVDGVEQPIKVNGEQDGRFDVTDSIEFYGVGLNAASTDTRVYWLVAGTKPGKRIPITQDKGGQIASDGFPFAVERKDRTIYFSALKNGDAENFFGAVVASQPVDQSLWLQHLDQTAQAGASIEVSLQGVTRVAHNVRVQLNGTDVTRLNFTDQSRDRRLVSISQSLLREGENTVRLIAEGGASDISLVDVIRISYSHSYVADNDSLKLTAPASQQVTVSGFTRKDIRLMDVTEAGAPQEIAATVSEGKNGNTVSGKVTGSGIRELLAFSDSQTKHPWTINANQPSSLRQPGNGADLLIITRRDYFSTVEPLKTLRESQGLSVAVADIEDIYDEFSFGNKTPQAVKDFATYAATSWKKKPRYVLLAGDASYDPKNYLGFGDSDVVPTKLLDTTYLETASDDWFVDFNNDGVPELAVGRLPFRNAQEASTMIAKIVGYEQSSGSEEVLLASDANDGFDFEGASAQLKGTLPASLKTTQINRGTDTAGAKTRLMEAINRGQKLVNYAGHGSVNEWRGNLLVNEDAAQMRNADHLTVFVMMTCLNGYFDDPALDSLAESLLKAERGGAVAVWSSSGMTSPGDQSQMNQALYRSMFGAERTALLGDAIRDAKRASSDVDIRRTWVLLGDPTMRVK